MKAYTDLQQSKKLAETLPLKSADMYYPYGGIETYPEVSNGIEPETSCPCWSLATLLEHLDDTITDEIGNDYLLEIHKENGEYYLLYHDKWGGYVDDIETDCHDNMIDACYEMIIKLKEMNLI